MPKRDASLMRALACDTGRTWPVSPSSPKAATSRGHRHVLERRGERERERQVDRRLEDAHPAGDRHVDVLPGEREPGSALEHREHLEQPRGLDAGREPPRRRQVARRHERLDLDEQRARALHRRHDRRAGDGLGALGEQASPTANPRR